MRQVWIPRTGGPEVLEVREAPDPEPGPGQVRVRVAAAGVNFADVMARIGVYPDAPKLPAVVGYEVAGIVDKLGPGVEGLAPGMRVAAMTRFGGYSDQVVVPAGLAVPLPDALTFLQAAALPVNYLTAWLMLIHLGNVHKGERVLVHAAAGGVGQAALQLCRWRGAEVIGTASASKHARLREAGCAHTIDYTTQDFEAEVKRITGGKGVHIVIDAVGGRSFAKSYRSLAPLGRLFMFGASSFAPGKTRSVGAVLKGYFALPTFKPLPLMNKNRGVFGVNLGHLWDQAAELRGMLDQIVTLTRNGTLSPVVDTTFPFDRAGEAHAYLQGRKNFGKVLLTP
ncbi:MAG: medium chain dehydrogenase/reductase family protein [Myxococcaceae bacterium]|nr:medium chain dehydrogenase/reductase family protein [Myxococcaceae bacterium]MCI0670303.1 medium chain dehydrogenase/reductase family protein [Myxococcaceae bacterium]